jgi:hypothetical protein
MASMVTSAPESSSRSSSRNGDDLVAFLVDSLLSEHEAWIPA